jgi:DNA repair exonuclease SbcCD nuclease subunit
MVILHTADWHLGNIKVQTKYIASRLRKYLFPKIQDVEVIFIIGDIFDSIVNLNSEDAGIIYELFVDLFLLCSKHSVMIRIVQGTFSHDSNQLQILQSIIGKLKVKLDVKIYYKMSIEINDKFSAIFIPDNLPFKNKHSMLKEMRKLLTTVSEDKVDYICIHGEFDFASHHFVSSNTYRHSDFSKFVKKKILCGHIHSPYQYKNIFYSGSFDRMRHNEESKKGFWVHDDDKSVFIENEEATKFITIDIDSSKKLSEILDHLTNIATSKFNTDKGYLRIKLSDIDLSQAIKQFFRKNYPWIECKIQKIDNTSEYKSSFDDIVCELEEPNEKNLPVILSNMVNIPLDEIKEIL